MVPKWSRFGTSQAPESIKNAPDDVVQRLKARAARHHRSLQGELLATLGHIAGRALQRPEEQRGEPRILLDGAGVTLRLPSGKLAKTRCSTRSSA